MLSLDCVNIVMSARSPRGSLSGGSDVAHDFEDSLKDLQQNNRYEISNLTLIAKESTEHAQDISKALEVHIKTVRQTSHHVICQLPRHNLFMPSKTLSNVH